MNRLFKWWRGEPKPVLLENVEPAKPIDKDLERRTEEAQVEFIQGLMKHGRRSAELRIELGRATLQQRRLGH